MSSRPLGRMEISVRRGLDCQPNSLSPINLFAWLCGVLVRSYKCSILKDARFQDEDARAFRIFSSYTPATRHGRLIRRFSSVAGPSYPHPQAWSTQCAWSHYPTLVAKQHPAISNVSRLHAFHIIHVSDSASPASSKMALMHMRGIRVKGIPWTGSQTCSHKRNGTWALFRFHRPTSNCGMGRFP